MCVCGTCDRCSGLKLLPGVRGRFAGKMLPPGGVGSIRPRNRQLKEEVAVDPEAAQVGAEGSGNGEVLVEYKRHAKTVQFNARREEKEATEFIVMKVTKAELWADLFGFHQNFNCSTTSLQRTTDGNSRR